MPQPEQKFTTCQRGHMRIGYYGNACPLCANANAAQVIIDEYFKLVTLCGTLLNKLQGRGTKNVRKLKKLAATHKHR